MSTFEIRIDRKEEDGWPIVVERTTPGEAYRLRAEGMLRLGPEAEQALLTPDLKAYGTVLGEALFRDQIRDAFTQARAKATGDDRLRVLLTVEDEDLRHLRWERLCAPFDGAWDLLALNQEVPFSLYLPSTRDRRFGAIGRRDLRVLIVAASPSNLTRYQLAPFDVAAAVASVQTALGDIPSDVLATGENASTIAEVAGPATLDAIADRITAGAYTLLHVVGHGSVARDGDEPLETTLYLANPDGTVDPVEGTQLLERLNRLNPRAGVPAAGLPRGLRNGQRHGRSRGWPRRSCPAPGARARDAGGGGDDRQGDTRHRLGPGGEVLRAAARPRSARSGAGRGHRRIGRARRHHRPRALQPVGRGFALQRRAGAFGPDASRDYLWTRPDGAAVGKASAGAARGCQGGRGDRGADSHLWPATCAISAIPSQPS